MTTRRILDHRDGDGGKRVRSGPARVRLLVALPAFAAAAAAAAVSSTAAAAPASAVSSVHTVAAVHTVQATMTKTSTTTLKTAKVGSATVLTNSKGFVVYTFAPDTSTMSKCNGSCAQVWPPVKGPAHASGVKGKFGTIKRTNGAVQATYNGHPLYTFTGDTAAKQAKGNGLNVNGGVWHEATTSGSAKNSGGSSGGSGGGYGY